MDVINENYEDKSVNGIFLFLNFIILLFFNCLM